MNSILEQKTATIEKNTYSIKETDNKKYNNEVKNWL